MEDLCYLNINNCCGPYFLRGVHCIDVTRQSHCLPHRTGQSRGCQVVHPPSGANGAGGQGCGSVGQGCPGTYHPVHKVCSDGQENGWN